MGRGKGILYLFTVLLLAGVLVCWGAASPEEPEIAVSLVTQNGETLLPWQQEQDRYVFFLPGCTELFRLRLQTGEAGQTVSGEAFQWEEPKTLTVSGPRGDKTVEITLLRGSELPSLHIDTRSGSMEYILMEKGNQEPGALRLYDPGGELVYQGEMDSLNGRGNVTWKLTEKKSFSLKLTRQADLLGMGQAQKWILLANSFDPSHLRNRLVFDFASEMGLAFSPQAQWVELYINGEYMGLYLLTERNEVHPQRVDISEGSSFLVSAELASRLDMQNYPYITTPGGTALRIHHSGLFTQEMEEIWAAAEGAILSPDGVDPDSGKHWQECIDLDSWAKKYLIEEIFGNVDSTISQFYYYDSAGGDGKIYAGPVWDYDSSMGFYNPRVLFADKPGTWFYALCRKDAFMARVKELYEGQFRPRLEVLLEQTLESHAQQIQSSCALDRLRWSTEDAGGNIQTLYYYMKERLDFLDSIWLEEEPYCTVLADWANGSGAVCYTVRPGEVLTQLPEGYLWEDIQTGAAFDPGQPITENIQIRAKLDTEVWEDTLSPIHLLPGMAAAGSLILLLFWDIFRRRQERPGKGSGARRKDVVP